jgi:stress response protein YsnF
VTPERPARSVSQSSGSQPADSAAEAVEVARVPLSEEVVSVSKREVVTGRVRIRTLEESSDKLVRQELDTAQVSVTRVPVNRIVDRTPVPRTEGDLTIVPVLEEVLVVEKKLLLKEEIHIRRTLTKETVEHSVTLRKQRAMIEELGGDEPRGE